MSFVLHISTSLFKHKGFRFLSCLFFFYIVCDTNRFSRILIYTFEVHWVHKLTCEIYVKVLILNVLLFGILYKEKHTDSFFCVCLILMKTKTPTHLGVWQHGFLYLCINTRLVYVDLFHYHETSIFYFILISRWYLLVNVYVYKSKQKCFIDWKQRHHGFF